jgi:hypothetical protein
LQFDFRWPRVKAAEYVVSMELEDADGDEATSFDVAIVTGGSIERHPGILAVDLERV